MVRGDGKAEAGWDGNGVELKLMGTCGTMPRGDGTWDVLADEVSDNATDGTTGRGAGATGSDVGTSACCACACASAGLVTCSGN